MSIISAEDMSLMQSYDICFVKSENIPAMFIETASGSMEYLHEDKINSEAGRISVISAEGNWEYNGEIEKITGRGNSTWKRYEKKPYTFSLKEAENLCGLEKGKKWCLMAGWRESTKMTTKIILDMAAEIGLKYTSQSTWVDLYLNGEYVGNYLLCEAVTVDEGRVEIHNLEKENRIINKDIFNAQTFSDNEMKGYLVESGDDCTGGYLFEKDICNYYAVENAGFVTSSGNTFSVKEPQHISKEQITYLRNYVKLVDELINEEDDEYWNYIDVKSFAKRFLVDEISLNFDSNKTSMYFYKEKGDPYIYAGPVWDYDSSLGFNSVWGGGNFVDYSWSTLDQMLVNEKEDILNWNEMLYKDPIFINEVKRSYLQLLPWLENMILEQIDNYAETIKASVEMDRIRWSNAVKTSYDGFMAGHYKTFDNNVRYLKWFLSMRVNYLSARWGIPYPTLEIPFTNEEHEVKLIVGNQVREIVKVKDGETLDVPFNNGWQIEGKNEAYRSSIPIFEDMILVSE